MQTRPQRVAQQPRTSLLPEDLRIINQAFLCFQIDFLYYFFNLIFFKLNVTAIFGKTLGKRDKIASFFFCFVFLFLVTYHMFGTLKGDGVIRMPFFFFLFFPFASEYFGKG